MSQDITFTASTTRVTHLSEIFQSVNAIDSQGLVIINSHGIILYIETNGIVNCQAVIDASLFNTYNIIFNLNTSQTTCKFGIDLSLVSYAFGSLNVNSKNEIICYLGYKGEGTPFIIEFEDSTMSETIEFLTIYSDLIYPYEDNDDDDTASTTIGIDYLELEYEVILKSNLFATVLQDLSNINTSTLFVYISNIFTTEVSFISNGPVGLLKLIYPNEKNSLEKIEVHSSSREYLSCFKFENFIKIFRGVKLSSGCKIIKDLHGVLCLQLICKDSNNSNYAGSMITINMMEIDNDNLTMNNIKEAFDVGTLNMTATKRLRLDDSAKAITQVEVPLFL